MAVQSVLQKVGRPWSLPKRHKKWRRWLTRQMQYTGLEIYLFKDAVCRPRETPRSCTPQVRGTTKCWKERLSGGGAWASLVFCRKHQAGKTRICSQIPRREDVSKSRRVLGYDANALYPNAMYCAMPCAKEVVGSWPQTPGNVEKFIDVLQRDSLPSPSWTSGFPESCGRSSKKCRRYFIPNPSQARQCRSIWKGTLRSNDADGNENVKKTIALISKTTTLHVHHAFLYISLAVFARLRREHA